MKNTLRQNSIDVYKGILISLMVIGHAAQENTFLFNFIYNFHMPSLAILSGFLWSSKHATTTFPIFLIQRFKRIILPAFIMGLICSIPFLLKLVKGNIEIHEFSIKVIGTFTGNSSVKYNFNCSPLWYLYALFFAELMFFYVTRLSKVLVALVTLLIICFYTQFKISEVPFYTVGLFLSFQFIPWIYLGKTISNYLNKDLSSLFKRDTKTFVLALILTFSLILIPLLSNSTIVMARAVYGANITEFTFHVLIALVGAWLIMFYARLYKKSSFFTFIGYRTLPFVGFNYLVHGYSIRLGLDALLTGVIDLLLLFALVYLLKSWPLLSNSINGHAIK
ncbi:acyltransferase family protein [Methylophilus sp. Leaf408]|uniref:acyltransferase family protein n=1 Tax=Methylophilus sp. Leaf408 TaxID=2876561 RepID=UPI001E568F5F|nr:acyltransferase family protein [Methylophilus sp. Leaf408]